MPPTTTEGSARCGCPESTTALSRRGMLRLAGAAGLVTASTAGGARVAMAASPNRGDVLVVVSLRGGMDGLSVVAPIGDRAYAAARPDIAVPSGAARKVDGMFGLHPALKPVFGLWDAGKIAAVQAVGRPGSAQSHFQAVTELENAAPGSSVRTGWLDRVVGLCEGTDLLEAVHLGAATLPTAYQGREPKIGTVSVDGLQLKLLSKVVPLDAWRQAVDTLAEGSHPELLTATRRALGAVGKAATIPDSTAGTQPLKGLRHSTGVAPYEATTKYPLGTLGESLRDIARLVKAPDSGLRVASVDTGNYDMHAGLGSVSGGWMFENLTELALSLSAFAADLGPHLDRVTLVTISEFGRRVTQNGSRGVDHGYGGLMFVMGGGIKGGKVYGSWPGLAPDKLENGNLAITTDYRAVLSEILVNRCGVGSMSTVFPGWKGSPLGLTKRPA